MKTAWFGFVAACGVSALAGCHDPAAPASAFTLAVTTLEAPRLIAPGSSLTVLLTINTACGYAFDHISETRSQSQVILTAIGRNPFPPILCPDETISYEIKAPLPSRFTVVVNEPGTLPPLTADVETGTALN